MAGHSTRKFQLILFWDLKVLILVQPLIKIDQFININWPVLLIEIFSQSFVNRMPEHEGFDI
jgi:hypothetical protein